jgi:hypothetical protein
MIVNARGIIVLGLALATFVAGFSVAQKVSTRPVNEQAAGLVAARAHLSTGERPPSRRAPSNFLEQGRE